jgi:hypothetical protein
MRPRSGGPVVVTVVVVTVTVTGGYVTVTVGYVTDTVTVIVFVSRLGSPSVALT